jgi:hypothetical protein
VTEHRVTCHPWVMSHCDSCHEDNDSYGFDLMDIEVGCVTFGVCCDVWHALDFDVLAGWTAAAGEEGAR